MHALLFDPGGTCASGHCDAQARPSASLTASAPAKNSISRLNLTAYMLAVYASQPTSPWSTQDSLPAAGQLCRAGVATRWAPFEGFSASTSLSHFPGLSWRTRP